MVDLLEVDHLSIKLFPLYADVNTTAPLALTLRSVLSLCFISR